MEEQRNTRVDGMKLTGKEFEELFAEVYPDERFKRHRHKRLAEEFDLSQATILTWTSRGTPSWIEPLLLMSKKLMEYEDGNAKPDGAGS